MGLDVCRHVNSASNQQVEFLTIDDDISERIAIACDTCFICKGQIGANYLEFLRLVFRVWRRDLRSAIHRNFGSFYWFYCRIRGLWGNIQIICQLQKVQINLCVFLVIFVFEKCLLRGFH